MHARGAILMPDMKLLWEIQVLDTQRCALEERLKDQSVPGELRNLKNSIDMAQEELKETREEYGRLKMEMRIFRQEDAAMREQIACIERELQEGLSPLAGDQVTLQRVQALKENLRRLEERCASLTAVMERIHRRIEEEAVCLFRHREKYRRLQTTYQLNMDNIRKALAQIPLTRQRLIDAVDSGLWKRYVQLRTRFQDPVARVARGACQGCGTGVPFVDLKRLKEDEGVVQCVNCGRLLYWERVPRRC